MCHREPWHALGPPSGRPSPRRGSSRARTPAAPAHAGSCAAWSTAGTRHASPPAASPSLSVWSDCRRGRGYRVADAVAVAVILFGFATPTQFGLSQASSASTSRRRRRSGTRWSRRRTSRPDADARRGPADRPGKTRRRRDTPGSLYMPRRRRTASDARTRCPQASPSGQSSLDPVQVSAGRIARRFDRRASPAPCVGGRVARPVQLRDVARAGGVAAIVPLGAGPSVGHAVAMPSQAWRRRSRRHVRQTVPAATTWSAGRFPLVPSRSRRVCRRRRPLGEIARGRTVQVAQQLPCVPFAAPRSHSSPAPTLPSPQMLATLRRTSFNSSTMTTSPFGWSASPVGCRRRAAVAGPPLPV